MQFTQAIWFYMPRAEKNWITQFNWINGKNYEWIGCCCAVNARFTQRLLQLVFTWKIYEWAIRLYVFGDSSFYCCWDERFWKLLSWNLSSLLHNLTYISIFDSLLFLIIFSVFRRNINNFFKWLAQSLFLADFQYLWNHTTWSCNWFSASSYFFTCIYSFSGSGFFRIQISLGPHFSEFAYMVQV